MGRKSEKKEIKRKKETFGNSASIQCFTNLFEKKIENRCPLAAIPHFSHTHTHEMIRSLHDSAVMTAQVTIFQPTCPEHIKTTMMVA